MKGGILMCALCALFPLSAGADTRWTLATSDTHLVVGVTDSRLSILGLENPRAGHGWIGAASRVPLMERVRVAGRETPTDWRFNGGAMDRRSGTLTLSFENASPRLVLRSLWRARPGPGPIEHWMEIENRAGECVTVSHQDSLSLLSLQVGGPAVLRWIRRGGGNASTQGGVFDEPLAAGHDLTLTSDCEDGASPVPWLAVQVGERHGLYVGWEFSGQGRLRARSDGSDSGLSLEVGCSPDFQTDVEPGETFHVPPAFVGCYAGDMDEGSYRLHRFIVEKLRPAVPRGVPDPILTYNLYLDAGGSRAKEADVLRSARFCREIGFEAFMPDAMWFPETGDWRWDPARFPAGIAPIEQYVHRSGLKMALWCAWTNGGVASHPDALSVRGPVGHPDWFGADFAPDWQPGPFYGAQLCLGSPEAKEWALRKTQALVGEQHLDYLKHDCGPIVNRCNKTTHRHRYGVDASYWATMGYYEVQEQLRAAYPSLVLENCSGGGHLKDFGVIARTHYTVTTDTLSNLPDRQSLWDSTFAFPPLLLQAYTYDNFYPVKGDTPGPFLWRSAMMGAWQIDPTDTLAWTEEERESAARAVRLYKEWIRPMFRDVKVHHILPRPDGVHWDGLFYWSPRLKRGTLYVFRPESPDAAQTIRLKGLEPGREYWVWCEDGSVAPGVHTGASLMEPGLTVRLPQPYTSDLVFLRDAALGRPKEVKEPGMFRLGETVSEGDAFRVSARLRWSPAPPAHGYRLLVSKREDMSEPLVDRLVSGTSATLTGLPEDTPLFWKVEAISWGGRRWSEGAPGRLATGRRRPLPGVLFISDMEWARATAGAGNPVRRDVNYNGRPITIGGRQYPKGIWTHAFENDAPADLILDLGGRNLAFFAADAGLDDAGGGGSVQFQVLVDGVVRAESPVMRPGQAHAFRVDVTGAKQVTLRVLNGGDGYTCDHAAWGLARFLSAGATDPPMLDPTTRGE